MHKEQAQGLHGKQDGKQETLPKPTSNLISHPNNENRSLVIVSATIRILLQDPT
jgi:hypothetical protein